VAINPAKKAQKLGTIASPEIKKRCGAKNK
jgi:hypothetical protein